MLYDPRWEQKTKADPFALHTLIAWMEKRPASEAYKYIDIDGCPLARYFRAQGYTGAFCGAAGFTYTGPWYLLWPLRRLPIPAAFDNIVSASPRTFGAALERARAVLAERTTK